jgi:hypothetical protein
MPQPNDLSRSLVALDQNSTIIAVIEMSQSSWLVAGVRPTLRRPFSAEIGLIISGSARRPINRPARTPCAAVRRPMIW